MNINKTKKSTYWTNFKNFRSLTKKQKKSFINLNILIVSLIIVLPITIAHIVLMFVNSGKIGDPIWFQWFMFVMCSLVVFSCGYTYFFTAFKEVFKWHRPGMATLVTIGSLVAYCYSYYPIILNTINMYRGVGSTHNILFFDSAAMIVTIIKFGETISDRLKMRTNDDLESIASLQVDCALKYDDVSKSTIEISSKDIKVGDLLMVQKGARFPVDGIIVSGKTEVDESMLTGESKPIEKSEEDKVIGSTNNLTNTVIMKATVVGKNTVLNTIINNVKKISSQKPKYQKIADIVALWLVPIVVLLALLAFFLHAFDPGINNIHHTFQKWLQGDNHMDKWSAAVFYAISTLSVACPCALGLAVPLATLVGASKAAKNGIIINRAETYEKIKKVDAIAFDKTGTLTEGVFTVKKILGPIDNIFIMNSLEKLSMHPLAKAFNKYVEENYPHINNVNIENVEEIPGVGLRVKLDDNQYEMTSLDYVIKNKYTLNNNIKSYVDNFLNQKEINVMQSITCFSQNNEVVNIVIFEDKIRPEAYDLVKILKHRNIDVYMISGDNEIAVEYVAKQLGIEHYYYNVKPSEKSAIIESIQKQGKFVAYVGDGINDLEALKQSNLSIAVNKENSIANAVSDVLILNKELMSILKTISLTKITRRMIIFNLLWTFIYNLITLPLTIIGFIPVFIGVFIMAASDITVLGNTLIFKLKKFRFISKVEMELLDKDKNINPYL